MCYKFAKCIEEKYPGVLKRDFLTNSFHLPVWEERTVFEKFKYEEGFAYLSNGGNISYVETPNLSNNIKAIEAIVDYAYNIIPYFGINQKVDHCYECEFDGEFKVDDEGFECPKCGNRNKSSMSVIRRVSGYLGSCETRPFNKGKHHELMQRTLHTKK